VNRGDDPRSSHARVHLPAVRRDFAASIRRFIAPGEEARAMSTLYVSRGAVEGCCYFRPRRLPNTRLHRAPISPAAGRACPALHCGTGRRRASVGAISTAEGSAPRGVRAVPPKPPVLRPPHPKAAAGALVVTFATAARFSRFHIPTPYQAQLVAASARFWRKIGTPCAVCSYPVNCACIRGMGITSHGCAPSGLRRAYCCVARLFRR